MIEMCASVARAGAVRVSSASGRPSHAERRVGDSVESSRPVDFSTVANSGSITSSRLSTAPGSWPWGSRTVQISPSPLDRPGAEPCRERRVGLCEQAGDVIERAALPRLGAVADEHHELVGMVPGRFDLEVGVTTDQRPTADQQLHEDRGWVGLRVGGDPRNDLAGEPVIGDPVRWCGPVSRRCRDRQRPRPVVLRRLVGQGDDALAGHSAVISASAARAELSSQIDLLLA